jgi:hypothetical protein
MHGHHASGEDDAPVLLEQLGPDDQIGDPALALERDE